ncbi:hypothetical protein D0Y65_017732 [Glycine soja]|uniref:Pectin acetylesterase n=1 Tax=Glycine soja TaxID=3848 RepID=A0A445JWC9_GLYSO|nr:hypothetical protein D0Y65_017732 [Glycine soja]RZC02760.1 hypothetical protein D0Y65_017732 [Glycine soja]
MEKLIPFSGILSSDPAQNTGEDTLLWRRIFCRSSRDREEVGCSSEARSYGKLLWMNSYQLACLKQSRLCFQDALLEDWQLLYTDNFRQVLPKEATVECLADAGFFLDEVLQKVCTKIALLKWNHIRQCLFPSEIVKNIKTPLFLVHPAYDFWQIRNILVPQGSDPDGHWQRYRLNIRNCNANMIDKLESK